MTREAAFLVHVEALGIPAGAAATVLAKLRTIGRNAQAQLARVRSKAARQRIQGATAAQVDAVVLAALGGPKLSRGAEPVLARETLRGSNPQPLNFSGPSMSVDDGWRS